LELFPLKILTASFCPEPGLDLDLAPRAELPLLGDAPLPLGEKEVSESHLSNSSLTNLSICSLFASSLFPSQNVLFLVLIDV
jgi:hypothetical protein